MYSNSYDRFKEDENLLSELYGNILKEMNSNYIELVDNQDFLKWATVTPTHDVSDMRIPEKDAS